MIKIVTPKMESSPSKNGSGTSIFFIFFVLATIVGGTLLLKIKPDESREKER